MTSNISIIQNQWKSISRGDTVHKRRRFWCQLSHLFITNTKQQLLVYLHPFNVSRFNKIVKHCWNRYCNLYVKMTLEPSIIGRIRLRSVLAGLCRIWPVRTSSGRLRPCYKYRLIQFNNLSIIEIKLPVNWTYSLLGVWWNIWSGFWTKGLDSI